MIYYIVLPLRNCKMVLFQIIKEYISQYLKKTSKFISNNMQIFTSMSLFYEIIDWSFAYWITICIGTNVNNKYMYHQNLPTHNFTYFHHVKTGNVLDNYENN